MKKHHAERNCCMVLLYVSARILYKPYYLPDFFVVFVSDAAGVLFFLLKT